MEKLEQKIRAEVEPHIGKVLALSGGVDSSLLGALMKPKFVISVQLPGDEKYNEIEFSSIVAKHLNVEHVIVQTDDSKFDEYMEIAVKAIGRPIPHFNIFALFFMYKELSERGVKELILGDGPDEVMCGYARDIIVDYLYKIYKFEGLEHYRPMIDKMLISKEEAIELSSGMKGHLSMMSANIATRKDMDDMSDGIAKHFGIKNIRPYQDNPEMDDYIKNLPMEDKIQGEFSKFLLRKIAEKYLPVQIAWRKKKVGGPVYPVNVMRDWMKDGEFDKTKYLDYQRNILK